MSRNNSLIHSIKWVMEVSQRFSRVDRNGRSAVTSTLATLGITFGVMTLIVVMSVMNGFQMSFITAIQEISSYHTRVMDLSDSRKADFLKFCEEHKSILSVTDFYEAQTLMTGNRGKESAAIIRAINPDVYEDDEGFRRELSVIRGSFNLENTGSIVLGATLAKNLGVNIGGTVNLLVLSGGSDVDLFSGERNFKVTGIFNTGYADINSSYCFVNIEDALTYFGKSAKKIYGLKLKNTSDDVRVISSIRKAFPDVECQSWREYNKAFFGALRIEKNMLLLMVALIFVVVAINIYNGMRRLVFERRSEIAIFSALGATGKEIKGIFIMRGFITGAIGAFTGVILGLLISVNTEFVFNAASRVMFWLQYFVTAVFNKENLEFVQENSTYTMYAEIPAQVFFREVFLIAVFGVVSPLIACWAASKNVLKMTVAEVLHNE